MKAKFERGSLLILVLWIIAILSVVAIALGYRVTLQIKSTETAIGRMAASYAARAALAQAITVLKKDPTLDVDTLNDLWANSRRDFRDIAVNSGQFSVETEEAGETRYGLTDVERKINLNTAPQEVLESLFDLLNIEQELVANLMDWIDEDDDDRNHGRGAEKDFYENLSPAYAPKNAPLEHFEELHQVKGFTPLIVEKLKSKATVYGSGKINLNTSTADTWRALGFESAFIEKVNRFRLGPDGLLGSEDDGIAFSAADFTVQLDKSESLEGKEKILLNKFQNYFRVTSTAFQVRAKVKSIQAPPLEITALLSIKKGKDVEVVFWHEN